MSTLTPKRLPVTPVGSSNVSALRQSDNLRKLAFALSALGGAMFTGIAGVSALVGYKVVKPRRRTMRVVPPNYVYKPEKVNFQSTDGLRINGFFYPNPNTRRAVIVCHGLHSSCADMHVPAITFQQMNYNVLSFDFRACGESEGWAMSAGFREVRDLLGAIKYLKTRPEVDPEKFVIMGYSMGGAATILAAAQAPEIKAIVTEGAFGSLNRVLDANYRHFFRLPPVPFKLTAVMTSKMISRLGMRDVNPENALRKLQDEGRELPIMIIHGDKDGVIPVTEALYLYEAAGSQKELWIEPDAGHVVAYAVERKDYITRVSAFLDKFVQP
jgi:uncharacterized protein